MSLANEVGQAAQGQAAEESLPVSIHGHKGTLTVSFTPDVPSDGSTPATA